MTNVVTKLAIIATAFTPVTAAEAHDYTRDIVCGMEDVSGNQLTYAFNNNSVNADGSFGGTMVETGFAKNDSFIASQVGARPIWIFSANTAGGMTLYSRAAPGWAIVMGELRSSDGVVSGTAVLAQNNQIRAAGYCRRVLYPTAREYSTAADVGDTGAF